MQEIGNERNRMRRNRMALPAALLLPVITGMVSAALTSEGMKVYGSMNKPTLSPPAWVFPVAWTILYLIMGLASYYVITADVDNTRKGIPLLLYALQLAMNFFWSILFFNLGMYLFACVWLFIMLCIVGICASAFYPISRRAAVLMIPYIVWLSFAAYLNMGAYALNNSVR